MARKSLAELKKHLKNKSTANNSGFYPFTKMQEGEEVHARLVGDPDENNDEQFYIETRNHKLSIGGKDVYVPCIYMYGDKCPICERSQKYYNADDRANGKYYYRNVSYLVRAVITKDPLPAGDGGSALNTVQKLSLNKEVKDFVINGIANFADDEAYPWDLKNGCDFIFRKGKKTIPDPKDNSKMKEVADYAGSGFARRASPLPDDVITQLEQAELPPLKSLRAKHPGLEKILAMLEAHDTGTEYTESTDEENHNAGEGTTVVAANVAQQSTSAETIEKSAAKVTPVVEAEKPTETSAETTTTTTTTMEKTSTPAQGGDEDDIMLRIKNRNKGK